MSQESNVFKLIKPELATNSKYDIKACGKMFRFQMTPCEHGICVRFAEEKKLGDTLPPFIKALIPGPEDRQIVHSTHVSDCIRLAWYHKLLGIQIESMVRKWAVRERKRIELAARRQDEAERLRALIG